MTSFLLIAALLIGAPAPQKQRDWKEAKILDVKYDKKTTFQTGDPRSGGGLTGTLETVTWTYVVDVDGVRYELREQNLKSTYEVGETLKFAIEKKNFYFIDKKGKEKKGEVVGKKELKPPGL